MQLGIVIIGLIVLLVAVTFQLGEGDSLQGLAAIFELNEEGRLVLVDTSSAARFMTWLGILCAGALGNLPSQDIMQRIFSSKSATVARRACYLAGAGYLVIGAVPVVLGLSADLLIPAGVERAVLPMLADVMLHPALAVVLVVSLLSTIMSTIDSAILAPATVMAKNVVAHLLPGSTDLLRLSRVCVAVVAALAFGVALMGENAYALLESGYELGMVSLLVPLVAALYDERATRLAALASMLSGTLVWLLHAALGLESFVGVPDGLLPLGIGSTLVSALSYLLVRSIDRSAPEAMVR
jgi:Na+/proline symporter